MYQISVIKCTCTSEHKHDMPQKGQAPEEVILNVASGRKTSPEQGIKKNRSARTRTPGDRRRSQTEAQPAARKAQTENNNNDAAESLWKKVGCVAGKATMEKGSSQQRRADGRIGGKGRAGGRQKGVRNSNWAAGATKI